MSLARFGGSGVGMFKQKKSGLITLFVTESDGTVSQRCSDQSDDVAEWRLVSFCKIVSSVDSSTVLKSDSSDQFEPSGLLNEITSAGRLF